MRKVEYKYNNKTEVGTFHEWGIESYVVKNRGVGNKTMAIVETEDGKILMIKPNRIKFIDETKNNLLDRFKLGNIGVRVSNEIERDYIIRLHQDILPDCNNYCDDYEEFPIMRVDVDEDNCLNGYIDGYNYELEFNIIDFDKFKEELER